MNLAMDVANKGDFNAFEMGLLSELISAVPNHRQSELAKMLFCDTDGLNRLRNGVITIPMVTHYVKKTLKREAKDRAAIVYEDFRNGVDIKFFSDKEMKEYDTLGIGDGFRQKIAERIYHNLASGVLECLDGATNK